MKRRRNLELYKEYVCPNCFHQVNKCTCEDVLPAWHLVHIDRNIQECIRVLNQKGYITTYCCEGHDNGLPTSIYISFGMHHEFKEMGLPEGFKTEKTNCVIRFSYPGKITGEEFEALKKEKIDELTKWAYSLDVYEQGIRKYRVI